MKITRRQLKRILEVSLSLTNSEVSAAKKKLEDEGGAASADQVADAVRQAEADDNDKDTSSQAIIDAIMEEDPDAVAHEAGDIIDKSGISI
tara:strand:+ start:694 stop:966 length:273 start_codon:yes stop_codon:yes gene_type:complete